MMSCPALDCSNRAVRSTTRIFEAGIGAACAASVIAAKQTLASERENLVFNWPSHMGAHESLRGSRWQYWELLGVGPDKAGKISIPTPSYWPMTGPKQRPSHRKKSISRMSA